MTADKPTPPEKPVDEEETTRPREPVVEMSDPSIELSIADMIDQEPGDESSDTSAKDRRQPMDYRELKRTESFGRYQLLLEMGQGGMAVLYLARMKGPEQFQKFVAIKKIHQHLTREQEFIDMFLDEARLAALINHPNVATIFDLGQVEDAYFLAMEYVHGQSVTDLLRAAERQRYKIPWTLAARIVADAATGLHAAHELRSPEGKPLGVVHRDVSPQNILISYDGNLKVVDFGVAYAQEKLATTVTGTVKGKPAYMSPEQTRGSDVDRRSDVFSLGTILWEMVCQKRLFREANDAATVIKVREARVPNPRKERPEIPKQLEQIILRALAKKPEDRTDTAGELAEQLGGLLASEGQAISPQKIAKLMERLFYDRKKMRDLQIQSVLEQRTSRVTKGAGMMHTTRTSFDWPSDGSEPSVRTAPGGRRFPIWLAIAGVVVIAGGVALFVLTRKTDSSESHPPRAPMTRDTAASARRPDAETTMVASIKSATVRLKVVIQPEHPEAVVVFQGRRYKGSVFQVSVPRSRRPANLEVSAPGFAQQPVVMVPTDDSEVTVKLKPLKAAKKPMIRKGMSGRVRLLKTLPE